MTAAQVFDYSGKNVFVAGGTSGINLSIALQFAAAGANVAVLSRSQEKVDAAVAELQNVGTPTGGSAGVSAVGYAADVRDYAAVEQAFDDVAQQFGGLDVVVSGAAGNFPAPATAMSPNAFKSVVDIDLLGSYHVARAAYSHLRKPGASLIHISAPQAFVPVPLQAHVCAAKAGVDMLTRTLALEWGVDGIRVNSLVPGPIADTEGMKRLAPTDAMQAGVQQSVPLGRLGQGDDLANAALFLASPLAGYITGAVLPVDGGWSLAGVGALGMQMQGMMKEAGG